MLYEFLKVDLLGTLYIDEVFFFYEEPQVFNCESKTGQKYLALLTDMDIKEWLLVPLSEAQLSLLKSNRISIREAYINPEDNLIWKVINNGNTNNATATKILPTDLIESDLPEADVYIDYTSDELMPIINNDLVEIAQKEKRDILDLILLASGQHIREIPCETLGDVISTSQQILYTLSMRNDTLKGRIPNEIRNKNTIVAVGTFAASFGVRFKSPGLSNLFGETEVTSTIKMFADLLNTKNDENTLKEMLQNHSKKTTFKYRHLMKILLQADVGLKVRIASPNSYNSNINLTTDDILKNLNLLDGEIKDFVSIEKMYGNMVGIHVDKKTFAFKSIDDENIIGKLSENFDGVTFEVPKYVEAEIERRVTFNEVTNEEKYIYTLLSINDNPDKEGEKDRN